MKRLVYITTSTIPSRKASSIQLMQMCSAFAAATDEVKLIAIRDDFGGLETEKLREYYGISNSFHVELHSLPLRRVVPELFLARAVWRERDDDWICYARGRDVLAPWLALAFGGYGIVEVHGRPVSKWERKILRLIQTRQRGRLVAISEALRSTYIRELGFSEKHFVVAPDGVDLNRFRPPLTQKEARARCGLAVEQRLVVYAGGLYPGRGLEMLFRAMVGQPARLTVLGGRNDQEIARWRTKAVEGGLEGVDFLGYQPPHLVPRYLQAADVLVMPYGRKTLTPSGEDTTAWMSPLKLFEYLAAGRPIVASDLPAFRDVLVEGKNALLVPPDCVESFRRALGRVLDDTDLATRLGNQAANDATMHTWERRARAILTSLEANSLTAARR